MSLGQSNNSVEGRQMDEQLKTLAALVEDPSSVPSTHIRPLMALATPVKDPTPSSGLLRLQHTHTRTHARTHN